MRPSCGSPISWLVPGLAMLLPGCASVFDEDGALAVVPYRLSSTERIIVSAYLNDSGPLDFAVDTGSSITVVLEETARQNDLQRDAGRQVLVHGLAAAGQFSTARIDRLRVGSEVWTGAEAVLLPGGTAATSGLDGILGIDFLSRYAIGYSSEERVIRLYPPSVVAARSYKGWASIPLRRLKTSARASRLFAIDIEISGRTIPALLDLGSSANLMNARALRYIGERLRKRPSDRELVGAVEATTVHMELEIGVVKTSHLRWKNSRFLVADIHVLDILELDHRPIAIIGADFFNQRDFVIDFARRRLLVRTTD